MASGEQRGGFARRIGALLAAFGVTRARDELRQRGESANRQLEAERQAEVMQLRAEGYERSDVPLRSLVIVAIGSRSPP